MCEKFELNKQFVGTYWHYYMEYLIQVHAITSLCYYENVMAWTKEILIFSYLRHQKVLLLTKSVKTLRKCMYLRNAKKSNNVNVIFVDGT